MRPLAQRLIDSWLPPFNDETTQMILRARIVIPVSQPPIEDGVVAIRGERIVAVGRWIDLASKGPEAEEVIDLGEAVLMPGLVNAHCHLDYTGMVGRIPPRKSFSDWIKGMVGLKAEWSYTDYARSWRQGAEMLLRNGTTTVLDVESVPELMPDMWKATPLRVVSFRELIGLKGGTAATQMVETAAREWGELADGRVNRLEACAAIGFSPHAPYSTTPDLLRAAAEASRERHWRLMTHVAESDEEVDMFKHRTGPLFDWLKSQRDMSDCGEISPVQHLDRYGILGENSLAVHANYLEPEDIGLLATRKVSIAHCPRSHEYFGHRAFPYADLMAAGLNICLGTDSLATVLKTSKAPRELSLFAEMQTMASRRPELPPETLLRMATVGGAVALGRRGDFGELSPGALADLIAIPYASSLRAAEEAAVHFDGKPARVMIGGKWQE